VRLHKMRTPFLPCAGNRCVVVVDLIVTALSNARDRGHFDLDLRIFRRAPHSHVASVLSASDECSRTMSTFLLNADSCS